MFFNTNSAILSADEKLKLKSFVKSLDTIEVKNITITAYCDSVGDSISNILLSQKRAVYVRGLLKEFKVKNNLIVEVSGKGEVVDFESDSASWSERLALSRKAEVKAVFETELKLGDKTTLENILFIGGRHLLLPESYAYLDTLLQILKRRPEYHIVIFGHICCIPDYPKGRDGEDYGTGLYNLSEARAKAIYDYLISHGIAASRLSYRGLKHEYPLGRGSKFDRRVEIKISKISPL